MLETEYEEATKLEFINNPLAYALYKVWKLVDTEKRGIKSTNVYESPRSEKYTVNELIEIGEKHNHIELAEE